MEQEVPTSLPGGAIKLEIVAALEHRTGVRL